MKKTNRSKHSKELKVLSSRECRRLAKRAASMALAAALAASTLCAPALAVTYTIDEDEGLGTVHTESNEDGIWSWQEIVGQIINPEQWYNHNNDKELIIKGDGDHTTVDTTDQVLDVGDGTTGLDIMIDGVDAEVEEGSVVDIKDNTDVEVAIVDSHLSTKDEDAAAIHVRGDSKVGIFGSEVSGSGTGVKAEDNTTLIIGGAEVKVGELIYTPVPQEMPETTIETTGTGVELNGDVDVTLGGATITSEQGAAMSVESGANVTIELNGENEVTGGETGDNAYAGINVDAGTSVTITDEDSDGYLTATGGSVYRAGGAGIGGNGEYEISRNEVNLIGDITIEGGTIEASGGQYAAAIGTGGSMSNSNVGYEEPTEEIGSITISGGTVTATGDYSGAGIGAGRKGVIDEINITGGNVTATGKTGSAGIGTSSLRSEVRSITISGNDTVVTAKGGSSGAGIGTGNSYDSESKVSTIQISGGTVTATGGGSGAGIGAGEKSDIGSIEISGGRITAKGGDQAAGIGLGWWQGKMDSILIKGEDTYVQATGGQYGAGIGSGYAAEKIEGKAISSIEIRGGTVIAKGGSYAAGIGGGRNDYDAKGAKVIGSIEISGGKVDATGGKYGAGIGTGYRNVVERIEISGGSVTAEGGSQAAGIGSGYSNSVSENILIRGGHIIAKGGSTGAGIGAGQKGTASNIEISGDETSVEATGGTWGAGIGAGYAGNFGTIEITGGNITAKSGKEASGIGYGKVLPTGDLGSIIIKDGVKLYAMGDSKLATGDEPAETFFAIDTRADVAGVTASILNGKFLEELNVEDSNGLYKKQDATFEIRDENGKVVYTFTLTYDEEGKFLYDSFAVNLAPGTYTIVNVAANENEEPAYDGKQVQGDPNYNAAEAENLTLKFVVTGKAEGSNLSTYNWLQFYTPTGGSGGEEIVTPNPDPDDEPELILTEVPTEEELPEEETPLAAAPEEIEEEETPLSDAPVVDESLAEIGDDDVALSGAPKTGDESGVFGLMAALSGMALAVMSFFDRKGRHARFGSQH